jgi:hypothetical protein
MVEINPLKPDSKLHVPPASTVIGSSRIYGFYMILTVNRNCFKVRFEVFTAVSMKMADFWVVPRVVWKDLWNVGKLLQDYTALQPRRQPPSGIISLNRINQPIFVMVKRTFLFATASRPGLGLAAVTKRSFSACKAAEAWDYQSPQSSAKGKKSWVPATADPYSWFDA